MGSDIPVEAADAATPTNHDGEARSTLSLEFSEPPLRLAQAEAKEAQTGEISSESPFTTLSESGPLGFIVEAGPSSPATHIQDIADADRNWQEPYNQLTAIDGHRLLDRYDNSLHIARLEYGQLPLADQTRLESTVNMYANPNAKITPEMDQSLASYPELLRALKEFNSVITDPSLSQARQLQKQVVDNLDDSINKRNQYGPRVAEIPGLSGATVMLSVERLSLERYRNGGWRS